MTGPVHLLLAFLILLGAVFGQNGGEEKPRIPLLSCWDPAKPDSFPDESLRSKILISPDGKRRAYTQVDVHYDPNFEESCRTHATLLVSSGGASFRTVYEQRTSKQDLWSVSLGPVAWSPNSRWLVVEEFAARTGSDAGGLDFVLFDAALHTTRSKEISAAIASKLDKRCELNFPKFKAFDRRSRLILEVWDWVDVDGSRLTHCVKPREQWLFDPISGQAKRAGLR